MLEQPVAGRRFCAENLKENFARMRFFVRSHGKSQILVLRKFFLNFVKTAIY
jgi:hypothetical protein